jgi:hypothetical protein
LFSTRKESQPLYDTVDPPVDFNALWPRLQVHIRRSASLGFAHQLLDELVRVLNASGVK